MLDEKARTMFSHSELSNVTAEVDADAYDKKVIRDYTRKDGSLEDAPRTAQETGSDPALHRQGF